MHAPSEGTLYPSGSVRLLLGFARLTSYPYCLDLYKVMRISKYPTLFIFVVHIFALRVGGPQCNMVGFRALKELELNRQDGEGKVVLKR